MFFEGGQILIEIEKSLYNNTELGTFKEINLKKNKKMYKHDMTVDISTMRPTLANVDMHFS
jgi:hypothetical protein